MKSFGQQHAPTTPVRREPFSFWFMRDDEPEEHQFRARVVTDIGSLLVALNASRRDNTGKAVQGAALIIARMLDNKDGTPARWSPEPLDPPEDAAEDWEAKFRAPDGNTWPMGEAEKFTRFEAGSSRRRWLYLMEEDDEVVVDAKDLMALMEWLVRMAAGRPTEPSLS